MPFAPACEPPTAGIGIGTGAGAASGGCGGIGIVMAGEFAGAACGRWGVPFAACPSVADECFAGAFLVGEALFFAAGFAVFGIVIAGMFICAEAGAGSNSAATANAAALARKDRGFTNGSASGHRRSGERHPQRHGNHHQIFRQ